MKRTLVLIRHAKAADMRGEINDFDRPLTDKGKADAISMGKELKDLDIIPGLILASPAKRTRQTAKRIALATGYDVEKIEWVEKLYHCTSSVYESVASEVDDSVKTVFIVGHNPGITEFAYQLDLGNKITGMPTCCVVAAHIGPGKWGDFPVSERKIFLYKHP